MNMEQMPSPSTPEKPPRRILEIGAGKLPLLEDLKEHGVEIGYSVALDFNKDVFQVTSDSTKSSRYDLDERIEKPRDKDIAYVVAEAYALPFKDGAFTDIIAANCFGDSNFKVRLGKMAYQSAYLAKSEDKDVEDLFKELARVLEKNGELYILETYTPDTALHFLKKQNRVWTKYFTSSQNSSFISKRVTDAYSGFHEGVSQLITLTKK